MPPVPQDCRMSDRRTSNLPDPARPPNHQMTALPQFPYRSADTGSAPSSVSPNGWSAYRSHSRPGYPLTQPALPSCCLLQYLRKISASGDNSARLFNTMQLLHISHSKTVNIHVSPPFPSGKRKASNHRYSDCHSHQLLVTFDLSFTVICRLHTTFLPSPGAVQPHRIYHPLSEYPCLPGIFPPPS